MDSQGLPNFAQGAWAKLKDIAGAAGRRAGDFARGPGGEKLVQHARDVFTPSQVIEGWQAVGRGVGSLPGGAQPIRNVAERAVEAARHAGSGGAATAVREAAGSAGRAARSVADTVARGSAAGGVPVRGALEGVQGLPRDLAKRVVSSSRVLRTPGGLQRVQDVEVLRARWIKPPQSVPGASGAAAAAGGGVGGSGASGAGQGVARAARGARGAAANGAGGAGGAGQAARAADGAGRAAGSAGRSAKAAGDAAKAAGDAAKAAGDVAKAAKPWNWNLIKAGFKQIAQGAFKAAKVSSVFAGVLSLVQNGYMMLTGRQGLPETIGAVVADTAGGFVGGGLGAVLSGGALAVAASFGITAGLPFFAIGFAATTLGYMLGNSMFQGLFGDGLRGVVTKLLGG
ncbi:MAG: hypothetical protein VKP57_01045 [Candidatus Sericytochromatia bacterium]|nr:hypothetical protein [Candidatus Sericytochromatia bacterium]